MQNRNSEEDCKAYNYLVNRLRDEINSQSIQQTYLVTLAVRKYMAECVDCKEQMKTAKNNESGNEFIYALRPKQKWPPYYRLFFGKFIFLYEKWCGFRQISLQFVPNGSDNDGAPIRSDMVSDASIGLNELIATSVIWCAMWYKYT